MGEESINELITQIEALKGENERLLSWQQEVSRLMELMLTKLEQNEKQLASLQQAAYINRIRIDSLPYELRDTEYKSPVFIPKFLTKKETRRAIIDQKKSISRFGDGEFSVIAGVARWNFQSTSDILAQKLKNVLMSNDEDFLVGLNTTFYGNLEWMKESDADGVRAYMRPNVRKLHAQLLDPDKLYAHGLMNDITSEESLSELREIWNDRDCVFIEGEHTGMGVGNDLFDNCRSIERIICPSENAIDRYDDIIKSALNESKDKLILLALGPTATALSYDLFKEGYQSVDIGHIDLYYEKYIRNLKLLEDVSIPYKYCSWDEVGERRQIEAITDEKYLSQVVDRIC